MLFSLPPTLCLLQNIQKKHHYILMALEQQCPSFPSTNIPHDNAVIRGTREEQSLNRIPPQGSNTSYEKTF